MPHRQSSDSSPSPSSLGRVSSRTPKAKIIPGRNFTVRAVLAGLLVGTVICAANTYFGLQTGWVSVMSMPASLMGFGIFRLLRKHLRFPFTPVENVVLQSVAGGMGIMPLGCGLVGVIPAMEFLLEEHELGPIKLSTGKLIIWSLGLCYFGVVFAVPLRRQVIIKERLRFPSGFSTAVLISVLHGQVSGAGSSQKELDEAAKGAFASLVPDTEVSSHVSSTHEASATTHLADSGGEDVYPEDESNWAQNMRLLIVCFFVSGLYNICTYFLPILRDLPIFGTTAAHIWLWTLNPSLAYVGQGIIMGTETTLHMLLGAVVGWGILSPLAKHMGWAPGDVDDWERGSKGWIVWVSLAIMLVDAVASLAYIGLQPLIGTRVASMWRAVQQSRVSKFLFPTSRGYSLLPQNADEPSEISREDSRSSREMLSNPTENGGDDDGDAPPEQRVPYRIVVIGLVISVTFCVVTTHVVFGDLVPLYATIAAVLMALVLSIMGVRALGETDLNPVSGISKLAQLFFGLIIPQSNKSSILINLVAGAISEAEGALQAGDLMQDLKTGHLLGAAPKAQFWGQVIGATFGAVVSAFIYRLYTSVYDIPGGIFQVPTAYVWIFTARLVTGEGLPTMAKEWAIGAGVLFTITTILRIVGIGKAWRSWIPGGIAVAVGMYNVPSFTLARAIGGILAWVWSKRLKRPSTPLIILASGFVLGEGFLSIVNLLLQSLKVPHL